MRELLVAGGGPVGLATALYAARAGLDVTVAEPRAGVIDKACGEGLMPGAVAALTELGVELEGHPISGIRYVQGDGSSRSAQAPFRYGPGRGVRRTSLHAALSRAVAESGIEVEPHAVRTVEDRGDHLLVDGRPTRYLVAADGLHSPIRKVVGLDAPIAKAAPGRYGLRLHVDRTPWTSFVEVHWARAGEAYVTPVSCERIGVAILTDSRRSFADMLGDFPVLAGHLAGHRTSKVRGAGPLRQRATRRARGRVLLVGDSAGYVDALTGEGIALGLSQARAAVAAIADGRPERYGRVARRLGWRHELLTQSLVTATRHEPVRARLVPWAAALPVVFGAAVNELARPA